MEYEILSEDLYKNSQNQEKKKKVPNHKKNLKLSNLKPMIIHILIILILVGGLLSYFFQSSSKSNTPKLGELLITGDILDFNQSYSGNLNVTSKFLKLETKEYQILEESKKFELENFTGRIYLENFSIVFKGKVNQINYGSNQLKINSQEFKLTTREKVIFNLNLNNTKFEFLNGNLILDKSLNHNFKNSTIIIEKMESSLIYDGSFTISGIAKSFDFRTEKSKVQILFNK